jgi:eukaryotic-like serine/threonine-protein kinase
LYQSHFAKPDRKELLLETPAIKIPSDWSPDGRFILYWGPDINKKTGNDLWALPTFGDRKPFPFANTPFFESRGQFSPDGRWVTYESTESGAREIYVHSMASSWQSRFSRKEKRFNPVPRLSSSRLALSMAELVRPVG